jgi:hypothetical protein
VLASAFAAVSGSGQNSLGLKRANKAVVVLVDGLGTANLRFQPGHAPFLNRVETSRTIECAFPSTTASSITSFATGVRPGQHNIVGYQVFDRTRRRALNMLTGWIDDFKPVEIQDIKTISEAALERGIFFAVTGPRAYQDSGFTAATMRGAKYLPAESIEERVSESLRYLSSVKKGIVYLYVPELDQIAHADGSRSDRWLAKLEEVDGAIATLAKTASNDTGILLTADHGIIDIDRESRVFLDDHLDAEVQYIGGDPRVNFVYLEDVSEANVRLTVSALSESLADACYVATREQVISAGWYGQDVRESARKLMPEIFVIAKADVAIYDRRFAKVQSLKMIGQHGGISPDEIKVPLIMLGAFA